MKNGLIVALLVFVVLLFAVIGLQGSDDKVGVRELKLEAVDKEKVTRIEVSLRAKASPDAAAGAPGAPTPPARTRVVLEKGSAGWTVASPDPQGDTPSSAPGSAPGSAPKSALPNKGYPVDEALVKAALDAVAELKVGDLIANKADKLAGYEIDDEQGQSVKVFAGDALVLDLVFGRAIKGGGNAVRRAGSTDVHAAKGRLAAATKKDLTGWRRKALFDVKADDIAQLQTTFADGTKTVVEQLPAPPTPAPKEGEPPPPPPRPEWKLAEPQALPAGFRLDPAQLGRAAGSLASARATDFAEGVGDDVTGLGAAHTVVEAKTRDGKALVLHLGREDDKQRTYARVGTDPQLYLLSSSSAKQVARPLDDLRDLALLAASVDDVTQIAFTGQTRVVVKQVQGSWQLVEPKAVPEGLDLTQIGTQAAALMRLRAARLATDAPASAFATSGPTVEVTLKDGKKQVVRFGAPVQAADGGGEPREYWVRGGVDDLTYVAPAFTRNRYDKPNELFRAPPSQGGGGMGQFPGMENLPPDVRKKLQEAMAKGTFPPPAP